MHRLLNALPLVLSVVVFGAAGAEGKMAETHMNIDWREAQIVALDGAATSIVIGDPTVVDVTLEDPHTLILFGKSPGETNLLVFGSDHKLMLNSSVTVSPETARHVSVYGSPKNTSAETLFSCGSRCVRVMSPTDKIRITSSSSSGSNASTDTSTGTQSQPAGEPASSQSNVPSGAAADAPVTP